jgi:hypothetical protein
LAAGALAFVLGLVGPIAVDAEIISVPSEASSSTVAALPAPTVLRGSPPSTDKSVPICPPGYTLSPGYGCIGPSSSDYTEGWPGYNYWPDYGYGYPFGGFPGFGFGAGRFHRFGGFHDGRFHAGRGFHDPAAFHGSARFGGFSAGGGHMGGFGHR